MGAEAAHQRGLPPQDQVLSLVAEHHRRQIPRGDACRPCAQAVGARRALWPVHEGRAEGVAVVDGPDRHSQGNAGLLAGQVRAPRRRGLRRADVGVLCRALVGPPPAHHGKSVLADETGHESQAGQRQAPHERRVQLDSARVRRRARACADACFPRPQRGRHVGSNHGQVPLDPVSHGHSTRQAQHGRTEAPGGRVLGLRAMPPVERRPLARVRPAQGPRRSRSRVGLERHGACRNRSGCR
eukprot:Amastigsp_a511061_66.p3 type:complete len:241 gc:universal Amastigsp_a511061_66:776-54(-)